MVALGKRLADRVKELREAQSLAQADLAIAAGIRVTEVSRIECGKTRHPRWDTMQALADALSCSLDELRERPLRRRPG